MMTSNKIQWITCFTVLVCILSDVNSQRGRSSNRRTCITKSRTLFTDCTKGMTVHFEDVANTSIVPIVSETKLDAICKSYQESDKCIQNYFKNCRKQYAYYFNLDKYNGYNDSYDFLCNQARQEYLDSRECYSDKRFGEAESKCNITYHAKLNSVWSLDRTKVQDMFCKYINEYLQCVENAGHLFCNETAAIWIRVMITKNLEPVFRQPYLGCALDKNGYLHFEPGLYTTTKGTTGGVDKGMITRRTVTISSTESSMGGYDSQNGSSANKKSSLPVSALIACVICLALIGIAIVIVMVVKHIYDKKKDRRRPYQQNMSRQPTFFTNNLASPVIYHTGAMGPTIHGIPFGPSSDELPGKHDVVTTPNCPPEYNVSDPVAAQINPDIDRNAMVSPPPPYAASGDDSGICNPLYGCPDEEKMSNVD